MKTGVLGGTFDPVHIGHLIIAEEVRQKLGVREVIFLPAGRPWLKENRGIAPGEHRREMLRLALASNPCFKLSTLELDRGSPSYSVETLPLLKEELGVEAELYFIVGLDALLELPRWKEPARLVEMCQLVAVNRPGYPEPDLSSLGVAVPGIAHRLCFVDVPQIGVSSSEVRERVARGLSIRYLVPEAVEEYIKKHALYL